MRSKQRLRSSFVPRADKALSPLMFGMAAWLAFPSVSAHADLAGLIAGLDRPSENWRMVLTDSPAGSIHQAELAFGEASPSTALAGGAGMTLPDGRRVAFVEGENNKNSSPDEDRVNRRDKKGRVVSVEPMLPPREFTAGQIKQKAGQMLPRASRKEQTAFVRPDKEKNIQLAGFFFKKKDEPAAAAVSPMLADLVTNTTPDVLATAYAPPEPDFAKVSPFDSILKPEPDAGRFKPEIGPKDHAWAASVLPPSVFSAREQQCLASGIYFEARGESLKGQAAVAQVILNRVRNPSYPDTICDVVYQNEDWRNRCQFSFACDNIRDRVRSEEHWKMAREVALAVTAGKIWLKEVGSATHYHAAYVRPAWARTMVKVGRIGLHLFYRTHGGGWS